MRRRPLTIEEILRSADAYRHITGRWPTKNTGVITDQRGETWAGVDHALWKGLRGLPGGSSLAQLLARERGARNIQQLPGLTEGQILAWADDYHEREGKWPTRMSGHVPDSGGESWLAVNHALIYGRRGLPGGMSLARLLARRRGVRNRKALRRMTEGQILGWADAHHARTGSWPTAGSGPVADAPGETWRAVDMALRHGRRGIGPGSSLALLLADKRGVRNVWTRPDLSIEQILAWADAHFRQTGQWPQTKSGPVLEKPEETWLAIHHALVRGQRGLAGGSSLAKLLDVKRGVPNNLDLPPFGSKQILRWAVAHHRRTGHWPTRDSGPIPVTRHDTWLAVDCALRDGRRGLRGGSSLAQFLARHGKKRNHLDLPPLTKKQIVAWAKAHRDRTGRWPNVKSGPVAEAPQEKWKLIDHALRQGHRGLPGGSSLARLLAKKCGLRNPACLPALTYQGILSWAELHFQRTSGWPHHRSGPVADAPDETWASVDYALRYGRRTLPGGSSLAKLLARVEENAGFGGGR
jgi:hypothetical protein